MPDMTTKTFACGASQPSVVVVDAGGSLLAWACIASQPAIDLVTTSTEFLFEHKNNVLHWVREWVPKVLPRLPANP